MSVRAWSIRLVIGLALIPLFALARPARDPAGSAQVEPGPGVYLVARREMESSGFARSVILLVRHDQTGTLGIVINRPTRFRLHELLPDANRRQAKKHPVYVGGPVAPHTIVLLMRNESSHPHLEEVTTNIAFSAERDVLDELLARKKPSADLRVYVGHAGWAPGQLESELVRRAWFLVPGLDQEVFGNDADDLWERLINRLDPPGIRVHKNDHRPA